MQHLRPIDLLAALPVLVRTDRFRGRTTHIQALYAYAYEQYVYESMHTIRGFGMAQGPDPTGIAVFSRMHRQAGQYEFLASDLLRESLDRMDPDDLRSIHRNYQATLNGTVRSFTIHPIVAHWMVSVLKHIEAIHRRQAIAGFEVHHFFH